MVPGGPAADGGAGQQIRRDELDGAPVFVAGQEMLGLREEPLDHPLGAALAGPFDG